MKSPIIVRRVVGHSMEPTLKQERVIIASPLLSAGKHDVVVARVDGREIIKRIKKIKDNKYFLVGDNPSHSRDSRRFGAVPRTAVIARVLFTK